MWNPIICHEMNPAMEAAGLGLKYNDYDYVLLHLLEDPEYREWATNIHSERTVYLDNSCYELGESMNNAQLLEGAKLINADYVFLPDVMGDGAKTRARSQDFAIYAGGAIPKSRMIGVVQGSCIDDIVISYQFFDKMGVGTIAFPFMYPWMKGASALDHARERVKILAQLVRARIINKSRRHHLLGTHHISEFSYYNDYDWISSIDTSNPVMAAFEQQDGGLDSAYDEYPPIDKPKLNLAAVWERDVPPPGILERNCKTFRHYCADPTYKIRMQAEHLDLALKDRKDNHPVNLKPLLKKEGRPEQPNDTINPRHYKIIIEGKEIQVADIIDALELNWKRAFAVKYLLRAGDKPEQGMSPDEKELDDIKKAVWYCQREIEQLKAKIAKEKNGN